jgi:hypothetical protein
MWEIGAYERGAWQAVTEHTSEADACTHLLYLLTTT